MMLGCPSVLCAGGEALWDTKAHNSAPWIVLHCAWSCPGGHVGLLGHPHLPHNTCPRYVIGHHSYFSMPKFYFYHAVPFILRWSHFLSFCTPLHKSRVWKELREEMHSSVLHAEHCGREGLFPAQVGLDGEGSLGSVAQSKGGEELSCTHFLSESCWAWYVRTP